MNCERCGYEFSIEPTLEAWFAGKLDHLNKVGKICLSEEPFIGKHIAVRVTKKRDGTAGYVHYRPWSRQKSAFDEFKTLHEANFNAMYIEMIGGSAESMHRKAAAGETKRRLAELKPPKIHRVEEQLPLFSIVDK